MQYRQISRTGHSWQWHDLVFTNLTKSILRSLPGVFRSPFCRKTLDSVGFHPDFNRPLITLWDQRDSSSSVICYRKWISGRLKSRPNRILSCSIVWFLAWCTPDLAIIYTDILATNDACPGYAVNVVVFVAQWPHPTVTGPPTVVVDQ